MLNQKHHRACIFAAYRQPLHNAQKSEPDRRKHTNRLITRQQADQKGRDCHGGDREGECRAASERVADMPDDHAADRPH